MPLRPTYKPTLYLHTPLQTSQKPPEKIKYDKQLVIFLPTSFSLATGEQFFFFLFLSKLSLLQWGWIIFFSFLSCLQLLSLLEWADCFFFLPCFLFHLPSCLTSCLNCHSCTIFEQQAFNGSMTHTTIVHRKKFHCNSHIAQYYYTRVKSLKVGFTCLTKSFYRKFHCEGQEFWHC